MHNLSSFESLSYSTETVGKIARAQQGGLPFTYNFSLGNIILRFQLWAFSLSFHLLFFRAAVLHNTQNSSYNVRFL